MAMKLCQIVAVVGGVKSRTASTITQIHRKLETPALLQGLTKRYVPADEDGQNLPSEDHPVRFTVSQLLSEVSEALTDLFDCVATQDTANCTAKANISIDGEVISAAVPLTLLLFLEKQLGDIRTIVNKLPVRDLGVVWTTDCDIENCVQSVSEQAKTRKVEEVRVLYPATTEHPAQVDIATKDVIAGKWTNTRFSGEIARDDQQAMLRRVEKLQDAVKVAREEANSMEVTEVKIGADILRYLFG